MTTTCKDLINILKCVCVFLSYHTIAVNKHHTTDIVLFQFSVKNMFGCGGKHATVGYRKGSGHRKFHRIPLDLCNHGKVDIK